MNFMLFMLPTVPATYDERAALRPIGRNVERVQAMLDQVREITQYAEQAGFDAVTLTEHHFHSEGLEMSVSPLVFLADLAARTQRIKLATLVLALPAWDPIRLAEEIAMLDHLSKGRFIAGIGRGYQDRWVKVLGQHYGVGGATSDRSDQDRHNREVFEEVYRIMKMAWAEDAFSYRGRFYQVPPSPDEGIGDWPVAASWTALYGAPGEVDDAGTVRKISVVPKPYTRPHPPLWQAFSGGTETVEWCAREDILLWSLASSGNLREVARQFRDASARHGRDRRLGSNFGAFRMVYTGDSYDEAFELGASALGDAFVRYFSGFGFFEGFRRAGETGPVPISFERMVEARFALVGTVEQVKEQIRELRDDIDPEWFGWYLDQGLMPPDKLRRQLERFSQEIMPAFRA